MKRTVLRSRFITRHVSTILDVNRNPTTLKVAPISTNIPPITEEADPDTIAAPVQDAKGRDLQLQSLYAKQSKTYQSPASLPTCKEIGLRLRKRIAKQESGYTHVDSSKQIKSSPQRPSAEPTMFTSILTDTIMSRSHENNHTVVKNSSKNMLNTTVPSFMHGGTKSQSTSATSKLVKKCANFSKKKPPSVLPPRSDQVDPKVAIIESEKEYVNMLLAMTSETTTSAKPEDRLKPEIGVECEKLFNKKELDDQTSPLKLKSKRKSTENKQPEAVVEVEASNLDQVDPKIAILEAEKAFLNEMLAMTTGAETTKPSNSASSKLAGAAGSEKPKTTKKPESPGVECFKEYDKHERCVQTSKGLTPDPCGPPVGKGGKTPKSQANVAPEPGQKTASNKSCGQSAPAAEKPPINKDVCQKAEVDTPTTANEVAARPDEIDPKIALIESEQAYLSHLLAMTSGGKTTESSGKPKETENKVQPGVECFLEYNRHEVCVQTSVGITPDPCVKPPSSKGEKKNTKDKPDETKAASGQKPSASVAPPKAAPSKECSPPKAAVPPKAAATSKECSPPKAAVPRKAAAPSKECPPPKAAVPPKAAAPSKECSPPKTAVPPKAAAPAKECSPPKAAVPPKPAAPSKECSPPKAAVPPKAAAPAKECSPPKAAVPPKAADVPRSCAPMRSSIGAVSAKPRPDEVDPKIALIESEKAYLAELLAMTSGGDKGEGSAKPPVSADKVDLGVQCFQEYNKHELCLQTSKGITPNPCIPSDKKATSKELQADAPNPCDNGKASDKSASASKPGKPNACDGGESSSKPADAAKSEAPNPCGDGGASKKSAEGATSNAPNPCDSLNKPADAAKSEAPNPCGGGASNKPADAEKANAPNPCGEEGSSKKPSDAAKSKAPNPCGDASNKSNEGAKSKATDPCGDASKKPADPAKSKATDPCGDASKKPADPAKSKATDPCGDASKKPADPAKSKATDPCADASNKSNEGAKSKATDPCGDASKKPADPAKSKAPNPCGDASNKSNEGAKSKATDPCGDASKKPADPAKSKATDPCGDASKKPADPAKSKAPNPCGEGPSNKPADAAKSNPCGGDGASKKPADAAKSNPCGGEGASKKPTDAAKSKSTEGGKSNGGSSKKPADAAKSKAPNPCEDASKKSTEAAKAPNPCGAGGSSKKPADAGKPNPCADASNKSTDAAKSKAPNPCGDGGSSKKPAADAAKSNGVNPCGGGGASKKPEAAKSNAPNPCASTKNNDDKKSSSKTELCPKICPSDKSKPDEAEQSAKTAELCVNVCFTPCNSEEDVKAPVCDGKEPENSPIKLEGCKTICGKSVVKLAEMIANIADDESKEEICKKLVCSQDGSGKKGGCAAGVAVAPKKSADSKCADNKSSSAPKKPLEKTPSAAASTCGDLIEKNDKSTKNSQCEPPPESSPCTGNGGSKSICDNKKADTKAKPNGKPTAAADASSAVDGKIDPSADTTLPNLPDPLGSKSKNGQSAVTNCATLVDSKPSSDSINDSDDNPCLDSDASSTDDSKSTERKDAKPAVTIDCQSASTVDAKATDRRSASPEKYNMYNPQCSEKNRPKLSAPHQKAPVKP